jgi:hypothetical protein
LKAIGVVEERTAKQKIKAEMDKELKEIRAEMDRLMLNMQQESQVHWRYEWPMKKKIKMACPKLLARRKQQGVEEVAEGS